MTVANSSRILAFLCYLLLVVGAVFVLIFQRKDEFAAFHARQSLALVLAALVAPAFWYAVAWLVLWVPQVGGPLAFALFSGVLAAYLAILFGWLRGLVDSLTAQQRAVPFFGGWARYLPL